MHAALAEHEIREERITVLADRAARRKHVRERADCFGGYERFAPNEGGLFTSGAQHHANLEGSECLRARDCGRAHRNRTRCECEARPPAAPTSCEHKNTVPSRPPRPLLECHLRTFPFLTFDPVIQVLLLWLF